VAQSFFNKREKNKELRKLLAVQLQEKIDDAIKRGKSNITYSIKKLPQPN